MRICFIGGKKDKVYLDQSKFVVSYLEKFGFPIDQTQMATTYNYEIQHVEDAFRTNYNAIKKSDVVIIEASELSNGIGFLIATALNEKKPVLALNNKTINSLPQLTLQSAKNKLFTYKDYTNNTLDKILNEFFSKVKSLVDTKFILIISPEIDRYLEWASVNRRMHKAQVVRSALEDIIEKDKEYKAALKKVK